MLVNWKDHLSGLKALLLSALLVLSSGPGAFCQDTGSAREILDVPYRAEAPGKDYSRCALDIYSPSGKSSLPVVVWYHGGGLTGGQKSIPERLKTGDMVVVAVGYRLLPSVTIDECLDDCAAALSWVCRNISSYGGDPGKIFLSGHSAGGYIVDMLGLDRMWMGRYGIDPDTFAGIVPFSGQAISHFAYRRMNGLPATRPIIDEYAPLYHVRADAPPIVIISGDRDMELYGRYEETAYFWRMLREVGHKKCYLYEIDGFNHSDMCEPAFHILIDKIREILSEREWEDGLKRASWPSPFPCLHGRPI